MVPLTQLLLVVRVPIAFFRALAAIAYFNLGYTGEGLDKLPSLCPFTVRKHDLSQFGNATNSTTAERYFKFPNATNSNTNADQKGFATILMFYDLYG